MVCFSRSSTFNAFQYSCIRSHRSTSRWRLRYHLVPTGCNGGRLTSCPWSGESGSGSVDSAASVALRLVSAIDSDVFCRSMVAFTPTFSGGIGDPTAPQPTNNPIIIPIRMDIALARRIFTRASVRALSCAAPLAFGPFRLFEIFDQSRQ